jgi:membrane protease YdiL (CAAX protease family)
MYTLDFFIKHNEFTPNSLQYYLLSIPMFVAWGTVQQFLLQSNILIRLIQILKNKNNAIVAAGAIFSLLHAPNIPLMELTFVVGLVCCILFSRHKNIFTLGITHGVMSLMAFSLLVPSVIDNFKPGPMRN